MKKIIKALLTVGIITLIGVSLTACSKGYKVGDYVELSIDGYNGYATASTDGLEDLYNDIIDEYGSDMSYSEQDKLASALSKAVKFNISPNENISNGDKVTFEIEVNNDKLKKYGFRLSGGKQTVTVSDLEELEEFDPFDALELSYEGISPNAYANYNNSVTTGEMSYLFSFDNESNLSNGDSITVTAITYSGAPFDTYCLDYGKKPTCTSKTYTVEGLSYYATKISDIPSDMLNKMDSQSQDELLSSIARNWDEPEGFQKAELLGYYFLTPKDTSSGSSTYNQLYLVYNITATNSKAGNFSYYYFTSFDNIIILEDGTCSVNLSNYKKANNRTAVAEYDGTWGKSNLYAYGYKDLDSMFNDCVTSKIDKYSYESTVK